MNFINIYFSNLHIKSIQNAQSSSKSKTRTSSSQTSSRICVNLTSTLKLFFPNPSQGYVDPFQQTIHVQSMNRWVLRTSILTVKQQEGRVFIAQIPLLLRQQLVDNTNAGQQIIQNVNKTFGKAKGNFLANLLFICKLRRK